MQKTPLVTVLMPVYNTASYLQEAVESIFSQTFTDFEFLVINDGSTDASAEILAAYQDERLRVIHHEKNQRLIATLNEGISLSRGKYIVRMDADDISMPERISRQVAFMESHPEVGLCGTWFEDFGPDIPARTIRYSASDTEIRIRHLYQTHIAHPTAILRKQIIDTYQLQFDPEYVHGEDYHFWVCMGRFCKLSNIPEVLVRKRDHPGNVSNLYAETQRSTCNRVKRLQFSWMGAEISAEEAETYSRFANTEWNFKQEEMEGLSKLLITINQANLESGIIDRNEYTAYLAGKWFHLCLNSPGFGKHRLKYYRMLPFRSAYQSSFKSRIRMLIQSLPVQ